MKYDLLIFISNASISAIDVDSIGDLDRVSLEGNDYLEYKDETSIDIFCNYIKDCYNIDEFSDIDMSVEIFSFNASRESESYMFDRFRTAAKCYIIDAQSIIPLLLLKETEVKKEHKYVAECFGKQYEVAVDSEFRCKCIQTEQRKVDIRIEIEKFGLLKQFDCNHLLSDEKKLREMEKDCQQQLEKNKKEFQRLEKKYHNLKKEYESYKEKTDAILGGTRFNSVRTVLSFQKDNITDPRDLSNTSLLGLLLFSTPYRCRNKCSEGAIVKKNQIIAEIESDKPIYPIKAPVSGRVFYICKNGALLRDGEAIAIISAEEDTRKNVLKWYEENKRVEENEEKKENEKTEG